jgi:LuxR family transcriptional regulator, quorum-sensing system regulator BjaR1
VHAMIDDHRAVLRYLVEAPAAATIAALDMMTLAAAAPFGFSGIGCVRIARPGEPVQPVRLFGSSVGRWGEAYARHGCAHRDLAVRRLFTAHGPFLWSDFFDGPLKPAEREVFALAAEHGLQDGFVTPILGPNGEVGAVIFVSPQRLALDASERSLVAAIANTYAVRGVALSVTPARPLPPLSARERECLIWSARGKSDTLTSQILDLSEKTVRMHVENARRKLGVHSRQHAVLEAWRQGWLVEEPSSLTRDTVD